MADNENSVTTGLEDQVAIPSIRGQSNDDDAHVVEAATHGNDGGDNELGEQSHTDEGDHEGKAATSTSAAVALQEHEIENLTGHASNDGPDEDTRRADQDRREKNRRRERARNQSVTKTSHPALQRRNHRRGASGLEGGESALSLSPERPVAGTSKGAHLKSSSGHSRPGAKFVPHEAKEISFHASPASSANIVSVAEEEDGDIEERGARGFARESEVSNIETDSKLKLSKGTGVQHPARIRRLQRHGFSESAESSDPAADDSKDSSNKVGGIFDSGISSKSGKSEKSKNSAEDSSFLRNSMPFATVVFPRSVSKQDVEGNMHEGAIRAVAVDESAAVVVEAVDTKEYRARKKRRNCARLIAVSVLLIIIVVLGTVLATTVIENGAEFSVEESNAEFPPSLPPVPTAAPTISMAPTTYVAGIILGRNVSDPDLLDDPTSPQGKALNYVTEVHLDSDGVQSSEWRVVQVYVLALLYYALGGDEDHWTLSPTTAVFLDEQVNECNWAGIACDDKGHVTVVDVEGRYAKGGEISGLTGELPSEISCLPELSVLIHCLLFRRKLRMPYQFLEGTIPSNIGKLSKLEELTLKTNSLEGRIPESLTQLTSLVTMKIGDNNLSGPIPTSLGQLIDLVELDLADGQLDGALPSSIGELKKLVKLRLNRNHVETTIPTTIGQLASLELLELEDNALVGSVPSEIAKLGNLKELMLQHNRLSDKIPSLLGDLKGLTLLNLSSNEFSGPVPESLYTIETLENLILNNNRLTGTISTSIGNLINLRSFWASRNSLTGTIPTEFGKLPHLVQVKLEANILNGTIDCDLGYYSSLSIDCDDVECECCEEEQCEKERGHFF